MAYCSAVSGWNEGIGISNAPGSRLIIDSVTNQYRSPGANNPENGLDCYQDPSCNSDARLHGRGVGILDWVGGQQNFFCSGALLNRTAADLTPLFMTATHCGVNVDNADSLLVTWFFATTICDDPGSVPDPATLPQTLGSQVLVRNVETDWTLVGLRGQWPEPDTVLLGWDSNYWNLNFSQPWTGCIGIHHPHGEYRRWSLGFARTHTGSRPDPDGGVNCIDGSSLHVESLLGRVSPGSSGSPLFDTSWRVRGTLSCATQADCDNGQISEYGRMDSAWTSLDGFLDPVDPVYVDGNYNGTERGTVSAPFEFVRRGIFGVHRGSTVHIEAGNYPEPMVIERAMTLRARNGTVTIGQ